MSLSTLVFPGDSKNHLRGFPPMGHCPGRRRTRHGPATYNRRRAGPGWFSEESERSFSIGISVCLQPDSGHIRYKLEGALSYFATVFIISPSFSLTHHFTFIFFLLFSKKGKANKGLKSPKQKKPNPQIIQEEFKKSERYELISYPRFKKQNDRYFGQQNGHQRMNQSNWLQPYPNQPLLKLNK